MSYSYTYFLNSSLTFKTLPNFWSTLYGEKDNKINELHISKLNLFQLGTPRKISSIFNVDTY